MGPVIDNRDYVYGQFLVNIGRFDDVTRRIGWSVRFALPMFSICGPVKPTILPKNRIPVEAPYSLAVIIDIIDYVTGIGNMLCDQ